MQIDNDTKTLLGYGSAISLRPQDFSEGYDMSTEDQFIFDEEWDYMTFTIDLAERSENYLWWFKDQMITNLSKDISTEQDSALMHSMYSMLERWIYSSDQNNFHENLWKVSAQHLHSLINH
jgi:hypothetical protein